MRRGLTLVEMLTSLVVVLLIGAVFLMSLNSIATLWYNVFVTGRARRALFGAFLRLFPGLLGVLFVEN